MNSQPSTAESWLSEEEKNLNLYLFQQKCCDPTPIDEDSYYKELETLEPNNFYTPQSLQFNEAKQKLDEIEPICDSANINENKVSKRRLKKVKKWSKVTYLDFLYHRNKREAYKKEYVKAKLIRLQKKCGREVNRFQTLNKALKHLKLDKAEVKVKAKADMWIKHYNENKNILEEIFKTESGPKTDGKGKKTDAQIRDDSNSFNKGFVNKYFDCPVVLRSYELLIDVIFADKEIEHLCKIFHADCCFNSEQKNHEKECEKKYGALQTYLLTEMPTGINKITEYESEESIQNGLNADSQSMSMDIESAERISDENSQNQSMDVESTARNSDENSQNLSIDVEPTPRTSDENTQNLSINSQSLSMDVESIARTLDGDSQNALRNSKASSSIDEDVGSFEGDNGWIQKINN